MFGAVGPNGLNKTWFSIICKTAANIFYLEQQPSDLAVGYLRCVNPLGCITPKPKPILMLSRQTLLYGLILAVTLAASMQFSIDVITHFYALVMYEIKCVNRG